MNIKDVKKEIETRLTRDRDKAWSKAKWAEARPAPDANEFRCVGFYEGKRQAYEEVLFLLSH